MTIAVKDSIKAFDLHNHWHPKNITSLTYPSVYNHRSVSWMAVRYGKSPDEIEVFKSVEDKRTRTFVQTDDEYGFQKHACIQFSLTATHFCISLFHAVPWDAVDRFYLRDKIHDKNHFDNIVQELEKFEGSEYYWCVSKHEGPEYVMDMKEHKAEEFPEFYFERDEQGFHTYFEIGFSPEDLRISSSNIQGTILAEVERLLPLYAAMAQRYH